MSKEITVSIKDSKSFVQGVAGDGGDHSYLSRLGTTLKSVQKDVNTFLTQVIDEEKKRGVVGREEEEIENIEFDADSSSDEDTTEQQNKRMKK